MMKDSEWWRGCVLYQVYPRSFQDTNNDGIGDLKGILKRLDYIQSLGVDGIWISPFFKSPMKDYGYDVSDYCDVDPMFGTLDDFKELLSGAHKRGLKILIDEVWCHTSDQHKWFHDASKKDWYVWADAKADGSPPNNWLSYFGGSAWIWDERYNQYYLTHFLKEQPALNLWNPQTKAAIFDVAKFWLDMGVDGFRLDVAHAYLYDRALRDNPLREKDDPWPTDIPPSNPMAAQKRIYDMCVPEIYDFLAELRSFVNQWEGRVLLGEAGGQDSEYTAATYVQTGTRLHMAYSFGLVGSDMKAPAVQKAVSKIEDILGDGWICWANSNHDFKRVLSRLNPPPAFHTRAAKTLIALGLSLRGSYCLYQGEELGLPQAELTYDQLVDPYDKMLYPHHVGRDGCRTPMPWEAAKPHAGFSQATPWLPVPENHQMRAVDVQELDHDSVLHFTRQIIALRKNSPALTHGDFTWLENMPEGVIGFTRRSKTQTYHCFFNLTDREQMIFNDILEPFGYKFAENKG